MASTHAISEVVLEEVDLDHHTVSGGGRRRVPLQGEGDACAVAAWGLRRYGFHGLSHAYVSRRAAEVLERPPERLRVVSCHLGAGASLAAVVGGTCQDTTMGFTPLEGLVMATRSGSVTPASCCGCRRVAACRRRRWPTAWSTTPASWAWPARPTCGPW